MDIMIDSNINATETQKQRKYELGKRTFEKIIVGKIFQND